MARRDNGKLRQAIEVGTLLDRMPPSDRNAELHALQAIFVDDTPDGRYAAMIFDGLTPEHFTVTAHGRIFNAAKSLYLPGHPAPDVGSTHSELSAKGEPIDDAVFAQIASEVCAVSPASHYYVRRLREIHARRQIIEAAARTIHAAYDPEIESELLCAESSADIAAISMQNAASQSIPLGEAARDAVCESLSGPLVGIETGLADLDRMVSPIAGSQVVIIAARPGMGKSALALQIARHQSITSVYITHEMSDRQLGLRAACAVADVPYHRTIKRQLSDNERKRLASALGTLEDSPVLLLNGAGRNLESLVAECRRLVARKGARLIIADYLQLMEVGVRVDSRQEAVAMASRALKRLALEANVPVMAVAAVNRECGDQMPTPAHLRESGSIEYDSDVMLILHREDHAKQRDPTHDPNGLAQIFVAKNRNGPEGIVTLRWDGPRMQFSNAATPPPAPPGRQPG